MDAELTETVQLIALAQEGERRALERLFSRYDYRVRQVVRRKLGKLPGADMGGSDVVQDAMLEAFKAFDRFEVKSSAALMGWLSKIVENRICSANRYAHAAKRDRDREVELAHLREASRSGRVHFEPEAGDAQPLEELERQEEERLFSEALEELAPAQREVLLLRDFERLPWKDVAAGLGDKGEDAARMSYHRAKIALKRAIDSKR